MNNTISFQVKNPDGLLVMHKVIIDNNKSLMEYLVGENYDILATCGGMALCGTCCIDVIDSVQDLPESKDDELDMLDSLPHANNNSRLSCQIKLSNNLDGLILQLNAQD